MSSTLADLAAKYPSPSERRKSSRKPSTRCGRACRRTFISTFATVRSKPSRPSAMTTSPASPRPRTVKSRRHSRRAVSSRASGSSCSAMSAMGRKIVKIPAMTYCYGATVGGMADQVRKVWKDWDRDPEAIRQEATYLAEHILRASRECSARPHKGDGLYPPARGASGQAQSAVHMAAADGISVAQRISPDR